MMERSNQVCLMQVFLLNTMVSDWSKYLNNLWHQMIFLIFHDNVGWTKTEDTRFAFDSQHRLLCIGKGHLNEMSCKFLQ